MLQIAIKMNWRAKQSNQRRILNQKAIEYDNITKTLNKNSLAMYQIQEMKVEPVMFS